MTIQADRLYLGEELIYEAGSTPAPARAPQTVDLFDRVSPGPDYEAVNTLPGTPTAALAITAANKVLGISGYAPAAIRDVGSPDGRFSARFVTNSGRTTMLILRYIDPDNWISWTSSGRYRVRDSGVNTDLELRSSNTSQVLMTAVMDGDRVRFMTEAIFKGWGVIPEKFLTATKVGVGHAQTTGEAQVRTLHFVPAGVDLAAVHAAIDAATTFAELEQAMARIAIDRQGITVTTGFTSPFQSAVTFEDPDLKPAYKAAATALSRYGDWYVYTTPIQIGAGLGTSGLWTPGQINIGVTPTQEHLDTVSDRFPDTREFVVHHELWHAIGFAPDGDRDTLAAAFEAANPPGFTYSTSFEHGGRPEAFVRGYGRTALGEDLADVFGSLMTPGLRDELLLDRLDTDAGLAAKTAAMKAYLASAGWYSARYDF